MSYIDQFKDDKSNNTQENIVANNTPINNVQKSSFGKNVLAMFLIAASFILAVCMLALLLREIDNSDSSKTDSSTTIKDKNIEIEADSEKTIKYLATEIQNYRANNRGKRPNSISRLEYFWENYIINKPKLEGFDLGGLCISNESGVISCNKGYTPKESTPNKIFMIANAKCDNNAALEYSQDRIAIYITGTKADTCANQ